MALSAAAGPASNLLLAWVSMILYKLCWYSGLGARRARADDVPILYGSHESEPGGFQSAAGAAV